MVYNAIECFRVDKWSHVRNVNGTADTSSRIGAITTTIGTMTAITVFYTLCVLYGATAFYLPGLAPVNYCKAGEATLTCKVRVQMYKASQGDVYLRV